MDSINIKNRFSIKISTLKRIIASDFLDRHKQKGFSRKIWHRNIRKHILLLRVCREALQWESWTRWLNERLTAQSMVESSARLVLQLFRQFWREGIIYNAHISAYWLSDGISRYNIVKMKLQKEIEK